MTYNFSGKRVLVTGASRGIGYAIAQGFVRASASVIIVAETDEVFDAARKLDVLGESPVTPIRGDITDRAGLQKALRTVHSLDVLVANAGTGDTNSLTHPAPDADEVFDRLIRINLTGTYNTIRAAFPLLGRGARIIITSSIHGQSIAPPGMSAYAASKGGVEAMMRSFARELGPLGINVNAVAPGLVATSLTLGAISKVFAAQIPGDGLRPSETEMIRALTAWQAIHNKPIDPAHLADAYLFLASPAGAAITGQSINVDHGIQFN